MPNALVNRLVVIRSNFSVGLYSTCLLRRLKREELGARDRVIIGEEGLHCIPPTNAVPDDAGAFYEVGFAGNPDFDMDQAAMEFAKMLLRNFTLDSFEAVREYCVETDQMAQMRSQSWYQFTRMMRNSLTHTQRWHFRSSERRLLPVSWRDKTIDVAMEGQEPNFTFYDWWDGCELWSEMHAFAVSLGAQERRSE